MKLFQLATVHMQKLITDCNWENSRCSVDNQKDYIYVFVLVFFVILTVLKVPNCLPCDNLNSLKIITVFIDSL